MLRKIHLLGNFENIDEKNPTREIIECTSVQLISNGNEDEEEHIRSGAHK